jgi:hypothetical protein
VDAEDSWWMAKEEQHLVWTLIVRLKPFLFPRLRHWILEGPSGLSFDNSVLVAFLGFKHVLSTVQGFSLYWISLTQASTRMVCHLVRMCDQLNAGGRGMVQSPLLDLKASHSRAPTSSHFVLLTVQLALSVLFDVTTPIWTLVRRHTPQMNGTSSASASRASTT